MEERIRTFEDRIDKIESKQSEIEKKEQYNEIKIAETMVYVKEIYKAMDSMESSLEALKIASNNKWELLWSRIAWIALGILGTIFVTKIL